MNSRVDVRPNYRDDIGRTLAALYLVGTVQSNFNRDERHGFVIAISSMALAYGVDPASFLSVDDVQLLRDKRERSN